MPEDIIAMVDAAAAGDYNLARKLHPSPVPTVPRHVGLATNPIPVKAAMEMLGRDTGELRLPMTPLDAKQKDALRDTLEKYGLMVTV